MCTLIVLWQVSKVAPLVVAQCRDELVARPAADVARFTHAGATLVGGRDLVAGGTWFASGPSVVCALTNRRTAHGSPRGGSSRGALVVDAAAARDVDAAARAWAAQDGTAYGPFFMLAADDRRLVYAHNAHGRIDVVDVAAGVHVLGNFGLDEASDPVVAAVQVEAQALVDADEPTLVSSLQALLARHGGGWPCVHLAGLPDAPTRLPSPDGALYGTRSAGILLRRGPTSRYLVAPGAPCVTPWRDATPLLEG